MAQPNYIVPFYHSCAVIANMILKTYNLASASWFLALHLLTTIQGILLCNLRISFGAVESHSETPCIIISLHVSYWYGGVPFLISPASP